MGLVQLTNGGVYQFITQGGSTNHIASTGGSNFPFQTYFAQGIITSTSSSNTLWTTNLNGILTQKVLHVYRDPTSNSNNPLMINTDSVSTTSITTLSKLAASGSLYCLYGSGSNTHTIDLMSPSTRTGVYLRIVKISNNSATITIDPSSTVNGSSSLSCSDPYCTIELLSIDSPIATTEWIVLSQKGAWS